MKYTILSYSRSGFGDGYRALWGITRNYTPICSIGKIGGVGNSGKQTITVDEITMSVANSSSSNKNTTFTSTAPGTLYVCETFGSNTKTVLYNFTSSSLTFSEYQHSGLVLLFEPA